MLNKIIFCLLTGLFVFSFSSAEYTTRHSVYAGSSNYWGVSIQIQVDGTPFQFKNLSQDTFHFQFKETSPHCSEWEPIRNGQTIRPHSNYILLRASSPKRTVSKAEILLRFWSANPLIEQSSSYKEENFVMKTLIEELLYSESTFLSNLVCKDKEFYATKLTYEANNIY